MRISKSSLTSFIACPEKYYLGYELRIKPIKKPGDLIIGSSTHHLISSFYIRNGINEACDLQEILQDYWSRYDLDNTDFPTMEELEASRQKSLDFARLFLKETRLAPLEVEYKFSLPVVNVETGEVLSDLELVGIIDLIDQPNGKCRAVEIKTKARKPDDLGRRHRSSSPVTPTGSGFWMNRMLSRSAMSISSKPKSPTSIGRTRRGPPATSSNSITP